MSRNQYTPKLYIPKDLEEQLGNFEKEIVNQDDVTITDFVNPFEQFGDDRISDKRIQWIKSESIGKAFKFCGKTRKIIEYQSK